jgi:hypothetical protein
MSDEDRALVKPGFFEVLSVVTHAERLPDGYIEQWAEVKILVTKNYDFEKGGAKLLKTIKAAADLIGAPEK